MDQLSTEISPSCNTLCGDSIPTSSRDCELDKVPTVIFNNTIIVPGESCKCCEVDKILTADNNLTSRCGYEVDQSPTASSTDEEPLNKNFVRKKLLL